MSARPGQLKAKLEAERGFAVPIALAILLVAMLMSGLAATLAIQTRQFTVHDTGYKGATEAANAGLRAAVFRLNSYQPDGTHCPTPTTTAVGGPGAPTSTLCAPDGPDQSNGLGNGANFSYWVSGTQAATDKCAGPYVVNATDTVVQRCITSVGTVGGVSARVQERVAAFTSTPAFPTAIFGTKSVTIGNSVTITTDTPTSPALIGTNGTLVIGSSTGAGGGTTTIDGYQLPPGVTPVVGQNVVNNGPTTGLSSPYGVPTPPYIVDPDTATPYDTATTAQAGTCNQSVATTLAWTGTWQASNCDYEITRGIQYAQCKNGGLPVLDCDASSGLTTADFNYPTSHMLYVPQGANLTLQGGPYYFCALYLDNNASITVPVGGKVTIFIDNTETGSNCQHESTLKIGGATIQPGTFTMNQNSTINASNAIDAQILVYGDHTNVPPANTVTLNNNGSSTFLLQAPYSNINLSPSNNTTFTGALEGYTVTLGQASHFTYQADASTLQDAVTPTYYPSYWEQCSGGTSSTTDPTNGC